MCQTLDNNVWQVIMAGDPEFRLLPMIPPRRTLVVTLAGYERQIRDSHPEIPQENILVEPHTRGTATCIAFAMYMLLHRNPDAVMVAVPSDLERWDDDKLSRAMGSAVDFVRENDVLMTIGLKPTGPDTRFGYIQCDKPPVLGIPLKVKTFTEKPPEEFARLFLKTGEFLWNSGMFIWKAETIREEYERYLPLTVALFKGWEGALESSFQDRFLEKAYVDCSRISVDYAIMEKTKRAWVYPAEV